VKVLERAKDLRILKQAEEIADKIWDIVIKLDHFAKDTIGKQLVSTADSIGANITEGYSRYHLKEGLNFYYYLCSGIFRRNRILASKSY